MCKNINELAGKLFEYFVINQRYFAIQKNGYYHAKNQYVTQLSHIKPNSFFV